MGNFIKKQIKRRAIKLPMAILVCALLVIGGGVAYNALALSGINITAPVAGVYWSGTQNITWTADCETGDYINIQYTTGSTFKTIATVVCSAYKYNWNTISYPESSNYQIRLYLDGQMDKNDISGVFTVDNTDPTSQTGSLTEYQTTATFNIAYTASDTLSGVDYVELYYNKNGVGFVKYGTTFTTSPISFDSSTTGGDGSYEFYTIAVDNAGNIEEAPVSADASTIVDTILPTITNITSDKANGSYTVGEEIDIDVTFSEIVTSTGDITVTLNTDGTCVISQIDTAINVKS
ncbi:MAG: hypothetical protein Q8N21_04280 [bacterium]|nr:hypothetical protein [bacterium]